MFTSLSVPVNIEQVVLYYSKLQVIFHIAYPQADYLSAEEREKQQNRECSIPAGKQSTV